MMDNHDGPHQSGTDGKTLDQEMDDGRIDHQDITDGSDSHQPSADRLRHIGDGISQSRSAIMGWLCKWVLAYIKWRSGVDTDVDASVMDSLGHWLCNREFQYI
jgi:hypothetical protein